MSEEQGYVRVVNVRGTEEDFRAAPGERVIIMDRSNRVMGNRHVMATQSRLERERVIDAYQVDQEEDIKRKGPMWETMMAIAQDIVEKNYKVALQCFCAPAPCHLDQVATRIAAMAQELRAEATSTPQAPSNESGQRSTPKA